MARATPALAQGKNAAVPERGGTRAVYRAMAKDDSRAAGLGSDELLRLVLDSAMDYAIFSMDPAGLVTSWNAGAERVLGFTEEEILGKSGDVIFPPEGGGSLAAEAERQTALRHGRAIDERYQLRKDGSRFWASGLLMPLAEAGAGFVKILRDRSERHLADGLLRASEERFRLLATSIPQLVFLSMADGDRTWGSPQWIDFTGLSLDASLGFGWLEAVHHDDREQTLAAWERAQTDLSYYVEHRIRRAADGEYLWHQTRARPIGDNLPSIPADWIGTMTDVHELRRLKDRQQVLMRELEHRTRNLLTIIQSIARQTAKSSQSVPDFMTEFMGRIQALGRVQTLVVDANRAKIDLTSIIEAELAAHGVKINENRIELLGAPLGLSFEAAEPLGLSLHELATNATKYGALHHPGGKLTIKWKFESTPAPQVVLDWLETGFSAVPAGERRGFGRELIEKALPYQLNARTKLEMTETGVHCEIIVPLKSTPLE